jgi:glycosyltransferase involved in cell wall biosynthesis
VPAPAHKIQFFIDQPTSWTLDSTRVFVRGWCFDEAGSPVRGIRLRFASLHIDGRVGLPRPDVRAALPRATGDNTGFEIRGALPAGRHALSVEVQTADGIWHELVARKATVRRRFLPLWIGGESVTGLIAAQMPTHAVYPARPVRPDRYPAAGNPGAFPKFSIVTPSFQQARFLGETMRSVLGQRGIVCDYVVQDGGSTDGSVEIIESFAPGPDAKIANPESQISNLESQISDFKSQISDPKSQIADPKSPLPPAGSDLKSQTSDPKSPPPPAGADLKSQIADPKFLKASLPRLAAWASEPDDGQADAIVKGFARTAGGPDDVMAWINSDDFYLPGALTFVADYFARHPEVDVLYGHRIVVNEESQEIARWFLPGHDDAILRLNDFVPQETLFWRRRIWDKAGGLDPSFKFALDWDLLLRFQAVGARIVRVPRFLACFRVHPAQKTSAAMHGVGQREIDLLRTRAQGREIPAIELEHHPKLIRYLRRSAFIQFLSRLGPRAS